MRWIGVLGAVMLFASSSSAAVGNPAAACKDSPKIVGECFMVHGRLSAWNGTPTFRIWRVGTKRILGVVGADGGPEGGMPLSIEELVLPDAFKIDVYGDYQVCPLTTLRPGRMQIVCIKDASHLVAQPR